MVASEMRHMGILGVYLEFDNVKKTCQTQHYMVLDFLFFFFQKADFMLLTKSFVSLDNVNSHLIDRLCIGYLLK